MHHDCRCGYPVIGHDARRAIGFRSLSTTFATPENEWRSLFFQHIPEWRVVRDEGAIVSFYEGLSVGERIPWRCMAETALRVGVLRSNRLFRYDLPCCATPKTVDRIREMYVPTRSTARRNFRIHRSGVVNSFFKNRKMWVGFAIPAFIHTLNGLHAYFPTLPNIPIRFWLDPFLVGRPLNALRPFQIVDIDVYGRI